MNKHTLSFMRTTAQALFLGLLVSLGCVAQSSTPDCQFTASFTSTTTTNTPVANKGTASGGVPCMYFIFTYWTNGASGVSVKLEGTNDVSGSAGVSYTALTATAGTSNPATGTNEGSAVLCCDSYPWIRMNASTFTGTSQTMIVRVYGWRSTPGPGAGGSAIGSNVNVAQWGGAATSLGQKVMASSVPVVVASDQSTMPENLAQVNGHTALEAGVNGSQAVGGAAAVGAVPTSNPLPLGELDSAGNLITPDYCTLKAAFNVAAASGNVQLVAVSGSKTIRICHVDFLGDTLSAMKLVTGTGSTCTSSADETGTWTGPGSGVFGIAWDWASPLITTAAKTLCLNLSAATTGGGVIIYSQR